jgi:hypothetical protein
MSGAGVLAPDPPPRVTPTCRAVLPWTTSTKTHMRRILTPSLAAQQRVTSCTRIVGDRHSSIGGSSRSGRCKGACQQHAHLDSAPKLSPETARHYPSARPPKRYSHRRRAGAGSRASSRYRQPTQASPAAVPAAERAKAGVWACDAAADSLAASPCAPLGSLLLPGGPGQARAREAAGAGAGDALASETATVTAFWPSTSSR